MLIYSTIRSDFIVQELTLNKIIRVLEDLI